MELVTFQFPSAKMLLGFKMEIEANIFEINLRNKTLTCQCTDEHIKLAIEKYGAIVIDKKQ